ncbi:hypothetical protein X900_2278 [Burkholderia pseudomallei BDU 2]|nr:hypothetical protein X900_2278 [Burkholderia pseudomallei BDU 2]KGV67438.1 hypothetical protein X890_5060 [Burkholderia pseudomallei MSHR4299]
MTQRRGVVPRDAGLPRAHRIEPKRTPPKPKCAASVRPAPV